MAADVHELGQANRKDVRRHLTNLFGRCIDEYSEGLIDIQRAPRDDPRGFKLKLFPVTDIEAAVDYAVKWNNAEWNLYVGVNPRKPGTTGWARNDDIEVAFFNFIDIDSKASSKAAKKRAKELPYNLAVQTGRVPHDRVHLYWEHEDPVRNMEAWRRDQVALCEYFHSDQAVKDARRIMRLGGTTNWATDDKKARGYVSEVTSVIEKEEPQLEPGQVSYVLGGIKDQDDDLDDGLGQSKEKKTPDPDQTVDDVFGIGKHYNVERMLEDIRAGKNWNNTLNTLIGVLINEGVPDAIFYAMVPFITVGLNPKTQRPYTEEETVKEMIPMIRDQRRKYEIDSIDYSIERREKERVKGEIELIPMFMAGNDAKADWVMYDFISRSEWSVLYGKSGVYKTFFALDLAYSVASDLDFFGFEKANTGEVVYVCAEGYNNIKNRYDAMIKQRVLLQKHGIETEKLILMKYRPMDWRTSDDDAKKLVKAIRAQTANPALIVIDTLNKVFAGGNENSNEDIGATTARIEKVAHKLNCHVMVLHHEGKQEGMGPRGHASLTNNAQAVIHIDRPDRDAMVARVQTDKQKEGSDRIQKFFQALKVDLGTDDRGKPIDSLAVDEISRDEFDMRITFEGEGDDDKKKKPRAKSKQPFGFSDED